MWLLPPDFPADAFDLPPGTWALPWYADDRHIDALMRLLVAGEARIREWMPLPWSALEDVGTDAAVRQGAALVLHAPAELAPETIVARARALPWPYVFWQSPRPALEGEGAWVEREIKRVVLSEVHRGLMDPEHPLARFHVERLPLQLIASMVGDPVDLLEIAQAALLHRLEHARDGLRKEDYGYSARWEAGRRLGEYLLRIPEDRRGPAVAVIRTGGRGGEDRGDFRFTAQAIQGMGLGLFVGEDLALGPLARSLADPIVSAGVADRLPGSPMVIEVERSDPGIGAPTPSSRTLPQTRITLPSVELTTHETLVRWINEIVYAAAKRDTRWASPNGSLQLGIAHPRRLRAHVWELRELAALDLEDHRDQRLRELFSLLLRTFSDNQWDFARTRRSVTALVSLVAEDDKADELAKILDAALVERVLLQSADTRVLEELAVESQARRLLPQSPWLDATWIGISAEIARLQGHSNMALGLFDAASHHWAAIEFDGRLGWLQSRISAACAAYDAGRTSESKRTLSLVADEIDADRSLDTIHAMVPLLRGFIAMQDAVTARTATTSLKAAADRFHRLHDANGEQFAGVAIAHHEILSERLVAKSDLLRARNAFVDTGNARGLTYAELVLGDAAFLRASLDEARARYREALRLTEHSGDDLARATAHHKLAHLEAQVQRYDVALPLERRALELERATGHATFAEQTERTIARLDRLAAASTPER